MMAYLTFFRRYLMWPTIGATLFLLASCVTSSKERGNGIQTSESAYGNYLAARYATASNDVKAASRYFSAALEKEPENELLRQNSFLSAVLAGEISKGAEIARPALDTEVEARLMRLSIAAEELAHERFMSAEAVLAQGEYGPFSAIVRQLLRAWASYGAGDVDKALSLLDGANSSSIFTSNIAFSRASMLDLAGRNAAAQDAYKATIAIGKYSDRVLYAYGSFLERQGKADEARAQYEKAMAVFLDSPMANAALARLDAGKGKGVKAIKPLISNAAEGAAEALFGPAQILVAQQHFDRALTYLEMARHVDPQHAAAIDLLALLMEAVDRPDDALIANQSIKRNSPYGMKADLNKASMLFRMDRRDEGVALYRKLAQKHPGDERLLAVYADVLRTIEDFDAALPLYTQIIDAMGETAGWQLYFSRGTVLERLGRWREGVPDFRKALEIKPNQPEVLNYLGYTYVDAGENLEEGMTMIEQALSLRPEAGFIVDSLGWAHYRLGNYEQAVRYLERAVEMSPGEVTISDHLADAYWQTDRRLEARFQWKHTLTLEENDDVDFAAVAEKLAHGLRDKPTVAVADP